MVQEHEMPLSSYTLIHTDAKLNEQQIKAIVQWTEKARAELKAKPQ